MNPRLHGRIAAITGGAKGIGAAAAKRFLQEDIEKVILVDLNLEQAEATAKELDPTGEKVFAYACNVGDYAQVQQVFGEIEARFGRIDILVNSAGITRDKTLLNMTKEMWDDVINVDLNSMYNVCKAVCPGMKARDYGKIVNMSSMAYLGAGGQANYSSAKAGILGFTRALARELAKHNITVNAICPHAVMTDMILAMPPEILEQRLNLFPRKRAAQPEEVAAVIAFLSSDDSSFVNGEKIIINDGRACT